MNDGLEEKKVLTQDDLARERTELSELRTGMATERTDLAYERTALTNSQTFLAYCRTAIGTFAAGIGMFEFVNNANIIHIGMGLMAMPSAAITTVLCNRYNKNAKLAAEGVASTTFFSLGTLALWTFFLTKMFL